MLCSKVKITFYLLIRLDTIDTYSYSYTHISLKGTQTKMLTITMKIDSRMVEISLHKIDENNVLSKFRADGV